ncbi:MAG TPA: hypothetical protein VJK26_03745, partial [Patescibacteria group bacterium]|nr:hypothetical protein [Patescibacteria group bacterium]
NPSPKTARPKTDHNNIFIYPPTFAKASVGKPTIVSTTVGKPTIVSTTVGKPLAKCCPPKSALKVHYVIGFSVKTQDGRDNFFFIQYNT